MSAERGDSYAAAHRYDGAVIERGRRDELVPCAVQPRDLAIVRDVARYRFLTTDQLLELWWPGASAQAGRRRLVKLFRAGYLDRFRPLSRRGSYPWTYQLGRAGHRLLQEARVIGRRERFEQQAVYDYRYVLHELQLNAWVLAWRRSLGDRLLTWDGETEIEPPQGLRPSSPLLVDGDWSAEGLRDARARLLRPDALIEVEHGSRDRIWTFLIEFDRTRRVDKNYEKFRRYDAFLNWWWRHSDFADADELPYVVFVCQDRDHCEQFLTAADRSSVASEREARGPCISRRQRVLFAVESDVHRGQVSAWRVPSLPPGHQTRDSQVRGLHLPGASERVAGCEAA